MAFCSNCGNQIDANTKFCGICGAPVEAPVAPAAPAAPATPVTPVQETYYQETPVQPTFVAPPPVMPVYQAEPVVSAKDKALGFVGMGLGIGGLFLAIFGIIYTLIGLSAEMGMGFGMSIGFGIFTWPLSIVGKILCGRSQDAGNTSGACSAGAKLALAAIIVSAVMMFFGFIDLFASM